MRGHLTPPQFEALNAHFHFANTYRTTVGAWPYYPLSWESGGEVPSRIWPRDLERTVTIEQHPRTVHVGLHTPRYRATYRLVSHRHGWIVFLVELEEGGKKEQFMVDKDHENAPYPYVFTIVLVSDDWEHKYLPGNRKFDPDFNFRLSKEALRFERTGVPARRV